MKTNVLELIIKAEHDYRDTVDNAVTEAEKYVDERRKAQSDHIMGLEYDWRAFERAENEKLEEALLNDKRLLEEETEKTMEQLKELQSRKLDSISDRLKEEVLSLHGNS